jgi:hypothetical protein
VLPDHSVAGAAQPWVRAHRQIVILEGRVPASGRGDVDWGARTLNQPDHIVPHFRRGYALLNLIDGNRKVSSGVMLLNGRRRGVLVRGIDYIGVPCRIRIGVAAVTAGGKKGPPTTADGCREP